MRAVIFDLWDTLVLWSSEGHREQMTRAAQRVGVDADAMRQAFERTRRPSHPWASCQNGSRPSGRMSTGVIPTRAAPASSSFAPSPTNRQSAGSTPSRSHESR